MENANELEATCAPETLVEAYQYLENFIQTIIQMQDPAPREITICNYFKQILGANESSLFYYEPRLAKYVFRVSTNPKNSDWDCALLQIDEDALLPGLEEMDQIINPEHLTIEGVQGLIPLGPYQVTMLPLNAFGKKVGIILNLYKQNSKKMTIEDQRYITLFTNIIAPIIELQSNNQLLEEKANSLELLYKIGNQLNQIRDEEELLTTILNLVRDHLKVDRCSLMIVQPDKKTMKIKKAIGLSDVDIEKIKIKIGEGIAGSVAASGKPLLLKDIDKETQKKSLSDNKKQFRTNSLLSIPLLSEGEVIGVINVNNPMDGLPFNFEDLNLLSKIGAEISSILNRSYIKLQLKKAEELDRDIQRFMV